MRRRNSALARNLPLALQRTTTMLYRVYQNQAALLSPLRLASQYMARALWQDGSERTMQRRLAAQCEVFSRMRLTHSRPPYGIASNHKSPAG